MSDVSCFGVIVNRQYRWFPEIDKKIQEIRKIVHPIVGKIQFSLEEQWQSLFDWEKKWGSDFGDKNLELVFRKLGTRCILDFLQSPFVTIKRCDVPINMNNYLWWKNTPFISTSSERISLVEIRRLHTY